MSCPDCFTGTVKEGEPTGTVATLHGLPTYIARPTGTAKGVVVIIPDAFGWELVNCRLHADALAKEGGYLVYAPDFMNGGAASVGTMEAMESLLAPSPSMATTLFKKPVWLVVCIVNFVWFMAHQRMSVVRPRVTAFLKGIRADPATGDMKVGVAGFCWGGLYTVDLCQDHEEDRVKRPSSDALMPLIDVAYTAHPSGSKVPEDYEKVTIPLSVAIGDVDLGMPIAKVKTAQAVLEKSQGRHELVIYPGAKHGFGLRADPSDPSQAESSAKAMAQCVAWYNKVF